MTQTHHTPLPWKNNYGTIYADNGHETLVAEVFEQNEAARTNADFIVRACNTHDALLNALEYCERVLRDHEQYDDEGDSAESEAARMARAAIAEAKPTTS